MGVVVENAGQCCPEAGKVTASVGSVDAVSKTEDRLGEAIIILKRCLNYGTVYRFGEIFPAPCSGRPSPLGAR